MFLSQIEAKWRRLCSVMHLRVVQKVYGLRKQVPACLLLINVVL